MTSAPYVAAGRRPAAKHLTTRLVRVALATRHSLVRRVRPRAVLAARVMCRAAQRLRPPTASTPVLVALAHGMPPRGPSAVRMWHASAGLSAMTVALGGNKGNPLAMFERTDEIVRSARQGTHHLSCW